MFIQSDMKGLSFPSDMQIEQAIVWVFIKPQPRMMFQPFFSVLSFRLAAALRLMC